MKRIISMLAATAAIVSCEMEINQLPVEPTDDLVTINAVSADTKTVLDGAQVLWENDDQIKVVISGTQRYEHIFTTTLENSSAIAKFKGVLTDEFKSDASLNETGYAIYPSDVEIDAGYIYHEIPAEQDGYIAPGQNLSYSVINTEDLKNGSADAEFKNLYSLIKVTVPEGIKKVTLSSDKPLAGRIPFSFAANAVSINETKWASMDESTKVKKVQLLPDASTLEAGKVYDLVVFPGEHNLTVKMENDGDSFEKTVNMTLAASKYYTLDFTTIFSFSDTEFLASPFGGGTIEIPFVTSSPESDYSVTFNFNGEDNWLSVQPDSKGAGVTEGSITLAVAPGENNSADRTAEVTIKEVASNKSVTVSVTQKCVITDLIGEYLESYTYNYASTTGSLVIAPSDDYIQGVYKVTICGVSDLYADYKDGVLSVYEGKFVKTLKVSNDYKQISADNLSVGGKTISNYLAIVSLGPATLSAEEEALVGTYTESWTYNGNSVISDNGMVISASEEASYGQLFVKLLTYSGYSFTGYADLVGNVLTVNIGKQQHGTFNKYASIDISLSLVVNNDGTLSFDSWRDANYKDVTEYVATKTATVDPGEGEGEGEGVIITAADLIGTWHEEFVMNGSSISYSEATISLVSGALKVRLFNYVPDWGDPAIIECDAELSVDGSKLTLKTNGITYNYEQFTSDIVLNVSEGGKKLTVSTVSWGYQSISNYTATQL